MASLVKSSDEFIAKHKGMKGFVVVVGERDKLQDKVKELASTQKLSIPLTFFADGPDGAGSRKLKLDPSVAHTVLVYENQTVSTNFALPEIKPDDIEAVIEAAAKVAPKG